MQTGSIDTSYLGIYCDKMQGDRAQPQKKFPKSEIVLSIFMNNKLQN